MHSMSKIIKIRPHFSSASFVYDAGNVIQETRKLHNYRNPSPLKDMTENFLTSQIFQVINIAEYLSSYLCSR